MKNSNKAAGAALATLFLAWPLRAMVTEDVVATVNGKPLLLSQYESQIDSAMNAWAQNDPQALQDPAFVKKLRDQTLEQMIDNELLSQEAKKEKVRIHERDVDNGIDIVKRRFQTDENGQPLDAAQAEQAFQDQLKKDGLSYSQFRERIRKQVTIQKLVEDQIKSKLTPPEPTKVRNYFDKVNAYILSGSTLPPQGMNDESAAAFMQIAQQIKAMSSERVRLSRILIRLAPGASDNEKKRALDAAEQIRQRLLTSTQTFAEVARAESEDPVSAAQGGDIGFLVRGVAPLAMEKAAFGLPVGEISKPILTPDGYNIIRVEAHLAANPPDFSQFKDDLGKFLMNLEFQKKLDAYVKTLKAQAVIERHLPGD